jgi:hypothetical protein
MDLERLWARRLQRREWGSVGECSVTAVHTPAVMVAEAEGIT